MYNLKLAFAIIGFIFIYIGIRVDALSSIYIGIGLALMIPICLSLWKDQKRDSKLDEKLLAKTNSLKLHGTRILIDLNDVQVQSNSWSEEKVIDNTKYAGINNLVGEGQRNIESLEKNLSSIEVEIPFPGSNVSYKDLIPIDNKTLLMKFAVQKTTYAYIDKQDPNNIYIDLEFLNA